MMPSEIQSIIDEFSEDLPESRQGGIPFGGTISSLFLMGVFAIGLYLFAISLTNEFTAYWKAAYWFGTVVTLIVSLTWTINLCARYGVSAGHMMGGVLLSCVTVACLVLLTLMTRGIDSEATNGQVLIVVLAVTFGVAAFAVNSYKTNLVFGAFLTIVQMSLSLILLVLLAYFWSNRASKRR